MTNRAKEKEKGQERAMKRADIQKWLEKEESEQDSEMLWPRSW